jgi:hypothetical protein
VWLEGTYPATIETLAATSDRLDDNNLGEREEHPIPVRVDSVEALQQCYADRLRQSGLLPGRTGDHNRLLPPH